MLRQRGKGRRVCVIAKLPAQSPLSFFSVGLTIRLPLDSRQFDAPTLHRSRQCSRLYAQRSRRNANLTRPTKSGAKPAQWSTNPARNGANPIRLRSADGLDDPQRSVSERRRDASKLLTGGALASATSCRLRRSIKSAATHELGDRVADSLGCCLDQSSPSQLRADISIELSARRFRTSFPGFRPIRSRNRRTCLWPFSTSL